MKCQLQSQKQSGTFLWLTLYTVPPPSRNNMHQIMAVTSKTLNRLSNSFSLKRLLNFQQNAYNVSHYTLRMSAWSAAESSKDWKLTASWRTVSGTTLQRSLKPPPLCSSSPLNSRQIVARGRDVCRTSAHPTSRGGLSPRRARRAYGDDGVLASAPWDAMVSRHWRWARWHGALLWCLTLTEMWSLTLLYLIDCLLGQCSCRH